MDEDTDKLAALASTNVLDLWRLHRAGDSHAGTGVFALRAGIGWRLGIGTIHLHLWSNLLGSTLVTANSFGRSRLFDFLWLKWGFRLLSILFAGFTLIYTAAVLLPVR